MLQFHVACVCTIICTTILILNLSPLDIIRQFHGRNERSFTTTQITSAFWEWFGENLLRDWWSQTHYECKLQLRKQWCCSGFCCILQLWETHINEAIKKERKHCIVVFSASLYLQMGECRPLGGQCWKVTSFCEGGFRRWDQTDGPWRLWGTGECWEECVI